MKDFEEREEILEEDFNSGGATVKMHRFGRILRITFYVLVYAVIAAIILRMCTNGTPKDIERISVNDELYSAYSELGSELKIHYQKYDEYTSEEENYGYFGIMQSLFIPQVSQVQVVFRYNNSTIEELPNDFPELCPDVPDKSETLYDVTLVKVIDLTPENSEDNDKEEFLKFERYYPTKDMTASKQTGLHNYYRYTFEGVDTEGAFAFYVDIYYNKAIDYEKDAYGSVRIFASDRYTHTYQLTSNDKKAFRAFEDKKN